MLLSCRAGLDLDGRGRPSSTQNSKHQIHSRKGDIMNKKTWIAMFWLLCLGFGLLVGCSKKEAEQPAAPAAESQPAAPAATPIDPATVASVSGRVKLDGAAPKAAKIDMSQDAACKGANTAETIVAADGKLANVFVYVKDGLGSRTFDVPKDSVTLDQKG